jgi:transposase
MTTTATTHVDQATAFTPTLLLAFELGGNTWTRGFTTGAAPRPRERHVPAGACQRGLEERRRAKSRFGLPEEARVGRCYEAGREGVWLPRFFVSHAGEHSVVDSASLAVHRRYRRAQTDRLAVPKLLTLRRRQAAGETKGWRVVRVPSVAAADRRQGQRALLPTQRARTRVLHRSNGLLAGEGMRLGWPGDGATPLHEVRQWEGAPLPAALCARLQRAWQKVEPLTAPLGSLEAERRVALRPSAAPGLEQVRQFATRRGLGVKRAWLLVMAFLAWRGCQRPQQVGAFAGLTPTPEQSGPAARALGMTQAGNGSRRPMAIAMAGGGGRLLPESLLTQWSQARLGQGRARLRHIGLVALARQ